jgi:hypothetical protein
MARDAARPRRPWPLTILYFLYLTNGLFELIAGWYAWMGPLATPKGMVMAACLAVRVVSLLGLWTMRRWGAYGFAATTLVGLGLSWMDGLWTLDVMAQLLLDLLLAVLGLVATWPARRVAQ